MRSPKKRKRFALWVSGFEPLPCVFKHMKTRKGLERSIHTLNGKEERSSHPMFKWGDSKEAVT